MALYLVGSEDVEDEKSGLFYLDPHLIQNAVPSYSSVAPFLNTYHCSTVRTLPPGDMCTSLAPGFYLRNLDEFKVWKNKLKEMKL